MRIEELAIIGLPIETEFGEFKPLSIYNYTKHGSALTAITFDKKRVLHELRLNQDEKIRDTEQITKELTELNENFSLKDILYKLMPIYISAYAEILSLCLFWNEETEEESKEKAYNYLQELTPEKFEELRELLMRGNGQTSQTAFLDPILQRSKEMSLKLKREGKESPNVATIVSSIVTYSGIDYKEISEWNVVQLLHAFERIQMFKNYDTTTLFATVAGDKVEIMEWNKNITQEDDSDTSSSFATKMESFESQFKDTIG